MKSLREVFLVDKLREAAHSGDEEFLSLIREIIREIKLMQVEQRKIASDQMVLEALKAVRLRKQKKLDWLSAFINNLTDKKKE